MKISRRIKIILSYFLVLIVFEQCSPSKKYYALPERIEEIEPDKLNYGNDLIITTKDSIKVKLTYLYIKENNIIGQHKNQQVKISLDELEKIEIIVKEPRKGLTPKETVLAGGMILLVIVFVTFLL